MHYNRKRCITHRDVNIIPVDNIGSLNDSVDNRLILQRIGSSFDERRHEAQFESVLLLESLQMSLAEFDDSTERKNSKINWVADRLLLLLLQKSTLVRPKAFFRRRKSNIHASPKEEFFVRNPNPLFLVVNSWNNSDSTVPHIDFVECGEHSIHILSLLQPLRYPQPHSIHLNPLFTAGAGDFLGRIRRRQFDGGCLDSLWKWNSRGLNNKHVQHIASRWSEKWEKCEYKLLGLHILNATE